MHTSTGNNTDMFGLLTMMHRVEDGAGRNPRWLARCSCGNEKAVYWCNVNTGKTLSCGCAKGEPMARRPSRAN
jgi:hypothetical protein